MENPEMTPEMTGENIDQAFAAELVAACEEYASTREEEGVPARSLSAGQLPGAILELLKLDAFPKEIQDDILALSQKLADFIVELVERADEETTSRPGVINCWGNVPSKAIHADAVKAFRTVYHAGSQFGALSKLKLPLALGAYGARLIGATAGSVYQCSKGHATYTGFRKPMPGRVPPPGFRKPPIR
jgi:hypothetical protein